MSSESPRQYDARTPGYFRLNESTSGRSAWFTIIAE